MIYEGLNYAAGRPADEPRDALGIALFAHTPDERGKCLWCKETHPCQRLRAAQRSRQNSPDGSPSPNDR